MRKTHEKQTKGTVSMYLKEISCIPLLDANEEKDLGRRIQMGEETALQKLVEANLRFVVKFAKQYQQRGLSFSDLISEGNVGLITAAKRFDPSRNVKFISYAVWWIRQSILTALADMGRPFKLPPKISRALYRFRVTSSNYRAERKQPPTLEEIALNSGTRQVDLQAIIAISGGDLSLNQPLFRDGQGELEDRLFQYRIPSAEQNVVEGSVKKSLQEALGNLKERERQILKLRYGLDDGSSLTLRQIAERVGVSRERVRQIQEDALHKMRISGKALPFRQESMLLSKILDLNQPSVT